MTLALHGKSRRRRTWLLFAALVAVVFGVSGSLMLTRDETKADSTTINFDSYSLGNINGQDGWSKTGPYDVEVIADGGGKALRISNGVADGAFGGQAFSKSLLNHAGETHATHGGLSGGTLQNHFEVSWDIKSFQAAQQPGLVVSFSPDRGDGARMSYLRAQDDVAGIDIYFDDVQQPGPCTPASCANFVETLVANDLSRTSYHNLKLVMDFKDGPANDIVRVYVDGILVHTGTSWEDYFRYDPEANADPHTHTVDSLLLAARANVTFPQVPANLGKGFVVDNLNLTSSTVPDPAATTTVVQAANLTAPGGGGWLFYDDNTETFDNTPGVLGSFVAGPAGQPLGSGSAEVTIGVGGRTNLSTYQFAGTPLESITQLGWSARTTDAGNPSYLVVNVDFNLSDTWQRRLVFVPTGVVANTWQTFDAIQGGAAQWVYSGATWPAPNAVAGTTPKTWNQILADYPNARIRVSDAHVGVRTGNPGPVETTNIDRFVFGTDIAVKVFDFEPTAACTTVCYVNAATGNDLNDGASPGTAKKTIQAGINAVNAGGTVNVAAGSYNEDVLANKAGVQILGAGIDQSIVSGPIGGVGGATFQVQALGVVIDGFTITRDGNTVADWNNPSLNGPGVAVQGLTVSVELRNSKLTGNRTGVDVNNSNGNNIHNNIIDNNHTGLIFRNQTDNTNLSNNFITNNRTVGVLFLDASGGTNVPAQQALSSTFNDNDISGNWYGEIVDRQSGGALPAPGTTNLKNFETNWYGTVTPVTTTANSAEPGYASLIPVIYGGSATNPGSAPDVAGPASANLDYTPWLCSGNDTLPAIGFQPQTGCGDIVVTTNSGNVGDTITVQVVANNVANLYGVQAFLQYDSSKLNFSGITLGGGLTPAALPPYNPVNFSQAGNQINFAYSQIVPSLPVSGSGVVLATLQFTATAPGVAAIDFRATPQTLLADNNGFSIGPATKTNGSITVSAPVPTGSVTGTILLQGRSNHSGASADIDPALIPPFAGSPMSLTSLSGAFTLSSVSTGSHTIQGRMIGYLLASKSITVAAGANSAGTVTLLGGDANMDQVINILDLSFIAARYLQSGPVYAPAAPANTTPDINGDNVVNILDLSLTASNYLKTSAANPWP